MSVGVRAPLSVDDLSDAQLRRIDQVCDSFESAWNSRQRPRIESFVEAEADSERRFLLQELVLLDIEYRRQHGERARPDDYQEWLGELDVRWLEAQLRPMPAGQDQDETDGSTQASFVRSSGEVDATTDPPVTDSQPRRLGSFQLLERVGVGGFGTVWRAFDVRLNRIVALKVPHPHVIESNEDIARFFREVRAAAQLRHPGIVTVHEVPVLDGLPVMVCDFVTGTSLRELMATRRLAHGTVAELVARIADALDYAHSMGAIHRDIKPGNIMLDPDAVGPITHGGKSSTLWPGEPRIVDFGLAYLDQEATQLTHDGAIIGTPAYMSPEQAAGRNRALAVDHRTDIYSLGVVLYELLTGTIPFAGSRHEVLSRVIDTEPRSPRRLVASLPRDLESICMKAMAKDPRQRYDSARELAGDLRHFLEGEPVRARPISLFERCLRRARCRPMEAALGLMGVVTVLAIFVLAVGYRYHVRLEYLFQTTEQALSAEGRQRLRAESFLYFHRMALAEREWSANNIDRAERLLEDCPPTLRGWEWRYLMSQCHHALLSVNHAPPSSQSWSVTCVRYSPDGRRLASASRDGSIRLWDAATGQAIRLLGRHKHYALSLAFQPRGHLLASGGDGGDILIWNTDTGALVRTLPKCRDSVYALAYSPDGEMLASGHGYPPLEEVDHMRGRGVVRCWNAATGHLLRQLSGHTQSVTGLVYSPDGQILASASGSALAVPQTASRPGELILRKAATGEPVRTIRGHSGPLTCVAYHPDGTMIATSSWDRTIKLWDPSTGDLLRSLPGHLDWVLHVEFSPDGRRLASGGADGAIKVWETAGNHELFTLRGHKQNVNCVTFSPDGRHLVSGSSDQTLKIWEADRDPELLAWHGEIGPIARVAFFPDGHRLLVAANLENANGRVQPLLTVLETKQAMKEQTLVFAREFDGHRTVDGIAISPDSRLVAAASQRGSVEIRWVLNQQPCFMFDEKTSRFQSAAFSPDGRKLAVAGQVHARLDNGEAAPNDTYANGLVVVFDLDRRAILWRSDGMTTGMIRDLAISPDGRFLATADNTNTVTLWELASGKVVRQLHGHSRLVSHVVFSPDGSRLASASWDSTVIVWDVASGLQMTMLQGHMRSVLCVAFSPDGRRLATSSEDQTVRLWDAESGQEVLTLRGHTDIVTSVAFSPDGNRLASAGADGTVQVREASPAPSEGSLLTPP